MASMGRDAGVAVDSEVRSVEVRGDAVIVHGRLGVSRPQVPPVAAYSVLTGSAGATHRIFDGSASWAPGEKIVEYRWDFGDGSFATSSGSGLRMVADHVYEPGVYRVCLTVADAAGQTDTLCRNIRPGALTLRHLPQSQHRREWEVCSRDGSLSAEFLVHLDQVPISKAKVIVRGNGQSVEALTDSHGRAVLDIDPQYFTDQIPLEAEDIPEGLRRGPQVPGQMVDFVPPARMFGEGFVHVMAAREGCHPDAGILWRVDCAAQKRLRDRVRQLLEDVESRLGELELQFPPPLDGPELLEDQLEPVLGRSRAGSVATALGDLALAVEAARPIFRIIDRDTDPDTVGVLLGMEASGRSSVDAVVRRLDQIQVMLIKCMARLDEIQPPGWNRR